MALLQKEIEKEKKEIMLVSEINSKLSNELKALSQMALSWKRVRIFSITLLNNFIGINKE